MAATDDILKTVSDLTKETGKYAKELLDKGYDKAKTFAEITRLNIELANRRRTLEKLYVELGKLYYANRVAEESDRLKAVCTKIDETRAEVGKLEEDIEGFKCEKQDEANEDGSQSDSKEATSEKAQEDTAKVIICTDCGAKNSAEDEFCVGCGRLLSKEDNNN